MLFEKCLLVFACVLSTCLSEVVINDFNANPAAASSYVEVSDFVMKGVSKAVLVPHNRTGFNRAVLFTLLDPRSDGAAFAGVRRVDNLDFSGQQQLSLRIKNRGEYTGYQAVLKNSQESNTISYSSYFDAPQNDFGVINLPFSGFEAQFHGKKVDDAPALDISKITSVGIFAYGGVFRDRKQNGVASLEIEYIKAV